MNRANIVTEPSIRFLDLKEGKIMPDIWKCLESGIWQEFILENWFYNDLLPSEKIANIKPLFPDLLPIQPGVVWDSDKQTLVYDAYHPRKIETSLEKFLEISESFFKKLNAKRIGVHLSGGLDSSLIMAVLKQLNIPFVPIGLQISSYEFRTERQIQNTLLSWGEDGYLVSDAEVSFYESVDQLPATQIPCGVFRGYYVANRLAHEFKKRGCDVVLSGQGADSLFVDPIKGIEHISFNIGNEFAVSQESEIAYEPHGIKLISFFADKSIIDFITSARIGQKDDALKYWGRRYFKDWLPEELTNYTYFADFYASTSYHLKLSQPTVGKIMNEAYELTHYPIFSPAEVRQFLNQDIYSLEHSAYIKLCSMISVAIWFKSLKNGGLIS